MMFGQPSRRLLRQHRRSNEPNVAHLLYGKQKNAVHAASSAKPSITATLMQLPNTQLPAAVVRAYEMNELGRGDLLDLLKKHRAMRRMDRTEVVMDALLKVQYPFSAHHYGLMMAHANDQRRSHTALKVWKEAVAAGKTHPTMHGAVLAAHRNAGAWREALSFMKTMMEDRHVVDAHSLHAILNTCRHHGKWEVGLAAFQGAVASGSAPNALTYLELLRLLKHAHLPSRWLAGLRTLDALRGNVELTGGHYNAVIHMMGGRRLWQQAVLLYHRMKDDRVQPTKESLEALMRTNASSVAHTVRCVAEAHAVGLPITDVMYRAVLINLFRMTLDHEAVAFISRELESDRRDAGNPIRATAAVSVALLDALLSHPRPSDAMQICRTFESSLGDVVGVASRGMAGMGDASQRWMAHGRVAVLDHTIILSPRMESLVHHYDSIFVPFSALRVLEHQLREVGRTSEGQHTRRCLRRLASLLKDERYSMMRVLPFVHQIQAHQYVVGGTATGESLAELRAAAAALRPSFQQKLLDRVGSSSSEMEEASSSANYVAIRSSSSSSLGMNDDGDSRAVVSSSSTNNNNNNNNVVAADGEGVLRHEGRITAAERVLAVAAMLKTLNADCDVHVLSTLRAQSLVVEAWNQRVGPHQSLCALRYPMELMAKAPPEVAAATPPELPPPRGGASSSSSSAPLPNVFVP